MREAVKVLLELSKARIAIMAASSTLVGYVLAAHALDARAVTTLVGVVLLAGGASALNQYQERDTDARMARTKGRPIPSGRISPRAGLAVALLLLAAGAASLALQATPLALGVLTVFWYNGVYTPLKRLTPLAAVPGGVVGSLPPVIGWTSAGGGLFDPLIMAVAFFFFVWQVPHFWLLLMRVGDDYEAAGMPTLTSILSRRQIARMTYVWMIATGIACMAIPAFLAPGITVQVALFAASVWLVWHATRMVRSSGAVLAFREINVYALIVMGLLSFVGLAR